MTGITGGRDPGDRDPDRRNLTRIVADRGYRGHNAPPGHKFRVSISGQRRRLTETIKRELRRRPAVEPVIGHAKAEHRLGRKLSRRDERRRRKRRPRRRRIQLQTPARMAGSFVVRNSDRAQLRTLSGNVAQPNITAFFTGDYIGMHTSISKEQKPDTRVNAT